MNDTAYLDSLVYAVDSCHITSSEVQKEREEAINAIGGDVQVMAGV